MLADITGRTIETVNETQQVAAVGTAIVVAAGLQGVDALDLARQLVKVGRTYEPNPDNKAIYDHNYGVFRRLYKTNAANFKQLNG